MSFLSTDGLKNRLAFILLFLGMMGFHLAVAPATLDYYELDPDRYYHFYVSKLYQPGHFPETLTQPVDARWDKIFPEKEFLFHVITGFFSFFWGDKGVLAAVVLMSSSFLACLYFFATRLSTPFMGFCAVMLPLLACVSRYYLRLHMVRPQVLAMCWFVVMLFGTLKKKPWIILSSCLGFALSYHGLQVPLIVGLCLVLAGFFTRSSFVRPLASGAVGIVVGVLLNPYFPAPIYATLQHIKIALTGLADPGFVFGAELYPISSDEFLYRSMFILGLIALALFHVKPERLSSFSWHKKSQEEKNHGSKSPSTLPSYDYQLLFITLVTIFFLGAAAKTPRAFEYVGPSATFLLVMVLQSHSWQRIRYPLLGVLGVLAAISCYHQRGVLNLFKNYDPATSEPTSLNAHAKALSRLPVESQGQKILNIDWDMGSYIIYLRPDMKFTSLLDPTFLYHAQPHLHESLKHIISNHVPDVFSYVKAEFDPDYIYTHNRRLAHELELNPHLVRLFPRTLEDFRSNDLGIHLFALSESIRPEFVSSFQFKLMDMGFPPKPWPQEVSFAPLPQKWPEDPHWKELSYPPRFMDFRKFSQSKTSEKNSPFTMTPLNRLETKPSLTLQENPMPLSAPEMSTQASSPPNETFLNHLCSEIAPSPEEIARLTGSDYVGVGGGPYIKIFRNQKILETLVAENTTYQLLSRLVALQSPVNPHDEFRFLVCSPSDRPMGLSVSFWQRSALEELCSYRRNFDVEKFQPWIEISSNPKDTRSVECFGKVTQAPPLEPDFNSVSLFQ